MPPRSVRIRQLGEVGSGWVAGGREDNMSPAGVWVSRGGRGTGIVDRWGGWRVCDAEWGHVWFTSGIVSDCSEAIAGGPE